MVSLRTRHSVAPTKPQTLSVDALVVFVQPSIPLSLTHPPLSHFKFHSDWQKAVVQEVGERGRREEERQKEGMEDSFCDDAVS